jgi:peroxiredoxin Q/BCP
MTTLKEGSKAPNFSASDQDGNKVTLDQYLGYNIILFFYPRDCFSSCTGGCALRDNFSAWVDKGFKIIAICNNNFEEHRNFILKHSLPYILVADADKKIADKYGAWSVSEKTGKLIHATFVISESCIIEKIITDVDKDEYLRQVELHKKLRLVHLN